jgi:hypothetical protein
MTWVLGWMYLRRADRIFDPLAARARQAAEAAGSSAFGRDPTPTEEDPR